MSIKLEAFPDFVMLKCSPTFANDVIFIKPTVPLVPVPIFPRSKISGVLFQLSFRGTEIVMLTESEVLLLTASIAKL